MFCTRLTLRLAALSNDRLRIERVVRVCSAKKVSRASAAAAQIRSRR